MRAYLAIAAAYGFTIAAVFILHRNLEAREPGDVFLFFGAVAASLTSIFYGFFWK